MNFQIIKLAIVSVPFLGLQVYKHSRQSASSLCKKSALYNGVKVSDNCDSAVQLLHCKIFCGKFPYFTRVTFVETRVKNFAREFLGFYSMLILSSNVRDSKSCFKLLLGNFWCKFICTGYFFALFVLDKFKMLIRLLAKEIALKIKKCV